MLRLLSKVYDIVFTFEDGSEILCAVTLNEDILTSMGWNNVDGFIDILSGRVIPPGLFSMPFTIHEQGTYKLSSLDEIFNDGGKLSWQKLP